MVQWTILAMMFKYIGQSSGALDNPKIILEYRMGPVVPWTIPGSSMDVQSSTIFPT